MIRRSCRAWKIVPTTLTKLWVTLPLFRSSPQTNPFPRSQSATTLLDEYIRLLSSCPTCNLSPAVPIGWGQYLAIPPTLADRLGKKVPLSIAILAMLLLLPRTDVSAQVPLATVRGTVQGQTGTPLSAATVMAKNLDTGLSRTVNSDAEGQFEILHLVSGTYDLQAIRDGFVSRQQKGLDLGAGESLTLAFVLEPTSGPQDQEAPGTGGEAAEPSSTISANQISESQLVGLPLNGRSYSQLATLQSGVSDPFAGSASRGGGSGGLTVAGGRATSNSFLLDGTNIMDTQNRIPRSAAGVQLGSDAVLQVRVLSSNYGAEYGRGSGGVLNSVSRSGTPEFHGTFFEFFRNSKLDARNFFDPGPEPTPFKRNQFGFTLTGPVRKDKTFFMGSFEGMRDRLTKTEIDFFPDEPARQGMITDASGEVFQTVPVNPRVVPYLELYPLPNSVRRGGGIGENAATRFLPTDENFFTIRLDHQISEQDSLFARYTFDDATSQSPEEAVLFTGLNNSRQQYLTLVETHIFNPRLLNSFRFGFTRPVGMRESFSSIEIPRELFFVPDAPVFGRIEIPGLTPFGTNGNPVDGRIMNSFQFTDDLLLQRGTHALKLGFDVHRYRWDVFSAIRKAGGWLFNSLESFLQGGPQGTTLRVALPGSDNRQAYRQTLVGFYIQDAYTVSSRFRFNLGLRYEFATLIHDRDGKSMFLLDPVRDSEAQIGPILGNNPSLRNLSPRLGISWSPGGSQSRVLSVGFGVYYDQMVAYLVQRLRSSVPFYKLAVRANFDSSKVFPDAVAAGSEVGLMARTLDYEHTKLPMVLRYNFSLQQQLPGGWRVQASYVGARGNHLFRDYETNLFPAPVTEADGSLFFPRDEGPINPAFGSVFIRGSDAQSFYNSVQVSANKSLSGGISLRAGYTYSKSVDDTSTHIPFGPPIQFGLMRTLERGLSDFNVGHRLVVNYFYAPSLGGGQRWWNSGLLAHVFGGWRLGGILSFRTGIPFSPRVSVRTPGYLFSATRPNLLPGRSNNPVQGDPEQYFDTSVYSVPPPGTLGNVGRNTLIAPSVFNMDISLQKEFSLDTKRRFQFRAEFFNLPNHTNFNRNQGASTIIFRGASGRLNPTAGRIESTATTARQVQFALRFSF